MIFSSLFICIRFVYHLFKLISACPHQPQMSSMSKSSSRSTFAMSTVSFFSSSCCMALFCSSTCS